MANREILVEMTKTSEYVNSVPSSNLTLKYRRRNPWAMKDFEGLRKPQMLGLKKRGHRFTISGDNSRDKQHIRLTNRTIRHKRYTNTRTLCGFLHPPVSWWGGGIQSGGTSRGLARSHRMYFRESAPFREGRRKSKKCSHQEHTLARVAA